MIPAPFTYAVAESIEHAVRLLADHGAGARPLAGGQSLLPLMKRRLITPTALIDIGRVPMLAGIRPDGPDLVIGAAVTHAVLAGSQDARHEAPLLAHVVGRVGDPHVRHQGTIGGATAHAEPAADVLVALMASGGFVDVAGPQGTRTIPVDEFFTGYMRNGLRPAELITALRVPRGPELPWAYERVVRRTNEPSIVAVAVAGDRVALANMGTTPLRAAAVERALAAGAGSADAAALAAEGTDPPEDLFADRDYRRHLARVLTRRALERARPLPRCEPAA